LGESNINNTLIKALKNIYGNTAQVKTGNKLSHHFNITKGLSQEYCLSLHSLRFTYENFRRMETLMLRNRNSSRNTTLYTLQFADNQVVLAEDKEDLEYITRKLKENYEKWGLGINMNKKILVY
jgi:hypothetical protein